MSKFKTPREPLTVTFRGESYTYYIRELPYAQRQELLKRARTSEVDPEETGLAVIRAIVLESVEEEDGEKAYTSESWAQEYREVVTEVSKAALLAQGLDLKERKPEVPPSPEDVEGNVEPSRTSGESLPSPSAAPSQS